MPLSIIGIDCATQANKVGLAHGYLSDGKLTVNKLVKPAKNQSVAEIVSSWIIPGATQLLAIDAPLGWPVSLGQELYAHVAGGKLNTEANTLFRRDTDRFIKEKTGKLPLDVGADRIARTAHSALQLLSTITELTGSKIDLAWSPELTPGCWAIETYPGATLKMSTLRFQGYKGPENISLRQEICMALSKLISFDADIALMEQDDDILDAAVCVLAGWHFINKLCLFPPDKKLAKKEGWIWVKKPDSKNNLDTSSL